MELDYLKGIMIMLMISFHLVYIGDSYPYAKQVVYTFHMPVFLVISGYLMNISKSPRQFSLTLFWLAVPYVVMESGYTVAASMLPIREHIDKLSAGVFFDKLLLHPLGPYWYLHTLVICGLTYYAASQCSKLSLLSRYLLMGLSFALYAQVGVVSLTSSLYFLAGAIIRNSRLSFLQVFRPSFLSFLAAGLLITQPANLHPATVGSVFIVYLVVSGCLAAYPHLAQWLSRLLVYLGRNTLPLFLFSPIFTIICKWLVPVLSFEPTGLLFLICSLLVCISGSLFIYKAMGFCGLSPYFFGPKKF